MLIELIIDYLLGSNIRVGILIEVFFILFVLLFFW